jgi:hypothetical protein
MSKQPGSARATINTSEPNEDAENDCRTINLPDHAENKFWLEENSAAAKRNMLA